MEKQVNVVSDIRDYLGLVKRDGMTDVLVWLEASDFFKAPASTQYHGNYSGGLAEHSLNVYRTLSDLNERASRPYEEEALIIVGLLHDACKVGLYAPNVLASGGRSAAKPWKCDDKLPAGHGEKSVILLLRLGLELTDEEILAIRWHMGPFTSSGLREQACWNKLSILLFLADYYSSTFIDKQIK